VADAANKRAVRVGEGGQLLEDVSADDLDVIACALGGEDGRTLFLYATPDFRLPPEEAARTRPAASSPAGWRSPTPAARERS